MERREEALGELTVAGPGAGDVDVAIFGGVEMDEGNRWRYSEDTGRKDEFDGGVQFSKRQEGVSE